MKRLLKGMMQNTFTINLSKNNNKRFYCWNDFRYYSTPGVKDR